MGFEPEFSARTEARNGVARIALTGELDIATVPVLLEHLTLIEQDHVSTIMLDLRDVSFVDSTCLHAFLRAHHRAKRTGRRLILIGPSQSIRRLFAVTRTEFLLDHQDAVSLLAQFTRQGGMGDPIGSAEMDGDG